MSMHENWFNLFSLFSVDRAIDREAECHPNTFDIRPVSEHIQHPNTSDNRPTCLDNDHSVIHKFPNESTWQIENNYHRKRNEDARHRLSYYCTENITEKRPPHWTSDKNFKHFWHRIYFCLTQVTESYKILTVRKLQEDIFENQKLKNFSSEIRPENSTVANIVKRTYELQVMESRGIERPALRQDKQQVSQVRLFSDLHCDRTNSRSLRLVGLVTCITTEQTAGATGLTVQWPINTLQKVFVSHAPRWVTSINISLFVIRG